MKKQILALIACLMLSVPIGTLSSDDAMGMLFRIASP